MALATAVIGAAAPVVASAADEGGDDGGGGEPRRVLFDFEAEGAGSDVEWRVVNDGVMGGLSEGDGKVADGVLTFSGTLSLENNGGFSSLRTVGEVYDLSAYDGVVLRVRGDGREYQVRFESDARFRERWRVSFRGTFPTVAGEWTEVKVPFSALEAGWRGRDLEATFNPATVELFGLVIADKKEGPFELEVDWIAAYASSGGEKSEGEGAGGGSEAGS